MKALIAMTAIGATSLLAPAALADQPTSLGELGKHTTLGMNIFSDLSYIDNQSDGEAVNPTGYGFDVKRGYLTFDVDFDDLWSARLRTDFTYDASADATQLYIKHLYVQRDFDNHITLRIGAADLPWVPWIQDIYHLRYVEKVLIDYNDFGTSADWGLHLGGDNGRLDWQVSLVSGAGYKHPERGKGMNLAARLAYNPVAGLQLAIGGETGKRGQDSEQSPATHTATRRDAAIAYVTDTWRIGLSYFYADDWNNVTTTYDTTADGYSLFAAYSLNPSWGLFARYDRVKPCKDLSATVSPGCYSGTTSVYYNAGVQYIVNEHIRFALVYKYNRVEDGFLDTANGSIGGVADGKYQEFGLFMQASF